MAKPLQYANTLDDIYSALSQRPLTDPADYRRFYVPDLNLVRGSDQMALLGRGLKRASEGNWYQGFLMGHPGVGKSTEVTRLIKDVEADYSAIRFSATDDLDASGFRPFDVLLVMMIKVVEETDRQCKKKPSNNLLNQVRQWFTVEEISVTQESTANIDAIAGIGPTPDSVLGKVLGLFASLKGEIKVTASRQERRIEYRLHQLSSLLTLVNDVIFECNGILKSEHGRQWLFIGEEFDKPQISVAQTEDLFINYASIFHNLRANLIFNIPISLVRSERRAQLPCPNDKTFCIPDTPVYEQNHQPSVPGRAALVKVLQARMNLDLFDERQMDRLIVASGGNLRDLFSLVSRAADESYSRDKTDGTIRQADSTKAITNLRSDYEQSLGSSPYDERKDHEIEYKEKASLLVRIYKADQDAKIPNPVLYSLLRGRAVQQFNGTIWYGVHPLIVDILHSQSRIKAGPNGIVPGGLI